MTKPELPRQRKGVVPQGRGRYPDYDVLAQADHWDEVTRKVVLDRVYDPPPIRFFDEAEAVTLGVLCDLLTAQDSEPRIPVLAYVDERLFEGRGVGYQYYDMPTDGDTWRAVARVLDEERFVELEHAARLELCARFAKGELGGLPPRAFSIVLRDVCDAFYAHPWAWNEIGFGGPAYPRGYAAFGNPHVGDDEPWEAREEFELDPVREGAG